MKKVKTRNFFIFGLLTPKGLNGPMWVTEGFQQRERQHSQPLNNDSFYRHPVASA